MKWTEKEIKKLESIKNIKLKNQSKILNRSIASIVQKRYRSKIKTTKLSKHFIKVMA